MGCVSSKGFSRGPDRSRWYLPLSRNASASVNREKDVERVGSLTSSSNGELKEEACQGSFLNIRTQTKHYKVLSPYDSFTFTCKAETQPAMQCEESKLAHTNNTDMKPVCIQKSAELDDERQHFLLCDYLHMQHLVGSRGTKESWWEDESKVTCVWDDMAEKNGRNYPGKDCLLHEGKSQSALSCESLDANHVGRSSYADVADLLVCNDKRKSLHTCGDSRQHDTEIIDMQELMEGLEDCNARTPSSLRSGVRSAPCIPDRQIPFNSFPGLTSVPGGDLGSPVWKKYYMPDNVVNCPSTWNRHSPVIGSPFNESPTRAPSQSSFFEVDDSRSVSSNEVPDANAVGLKFLLSPANSSFYPSPVSKAYSVFLSVDGVVHGSNTVDGISDGGTTQMSASLYDINSPYRSRNLSTESMCGCIEHEGAGIDMKNLYKSPPDLTRHSSRRPSMESVYDPGSPLFDPSLMATFEEALKASTCANTYDDWLRFSIDENSKLLSSSASTSESFHTFMDAENTPAEQTTETRPTISKYESAVENKGSLANYQDRCPPRGEGKVVLYFTSLRGVRKTYEDCCNVRLILRGLGVQVDERDVWMHSEFKNELNDVLNGLFMGMPLVPRLFIKGRYVGGAEVIKQLHEEGILSCLMDGLTMGLIHSVCSGCGDARFVPCLTCNGSRKVPNADNEVTQCCSCNENGLLMCPMCII
ncbi:hypothetical protein L7F22_025967 [Adiantum nelumboides]|nr:hypothetical protein [Adiantum nelumboides]